jgi:hypothetical protein
MAPGGVEPPVPVSRADHPGAERADETAQQYPDDPKGGHDVDPS